MPKGDGQVRLARPVRDPPRRRDPNSTASSFKPTLQLAACPRCSGDLSITSDIYGVEILCLQCGHRVEDQTRIAEEVARMKALHTVRDSRRWKRPVINGVRM